jgi:hypothetical protein
MNNKYINMSPQQLYDWLRKSYNSNNLYDDKSELLLRLDTEFENIKSLGNPVERSVEYFVSKILSGDSINVTSDSQAVVDTIQQVYTWSNLVGKKSAYVRDYALLGDLFMKVRNTEDKVIIENINPSYVTFVNQDARGNIISIRIDIPYVADDGKSYWYTEYWDKEDAYVSVWEHTLSPESSLESLGDPVMYNPLEVYGIDFIPIVQVQFKDLNLNRGHACVYHALDKIDELNRMMTRLHEQIFVGSNRAWFLDISNKQAGKLSLSKGLSKNQTDGAMIEVNGNPVSAVANLPYNDLLNVVNAMGEELIRDLPELRAYSISETNLSGKAIALLLAPAIERAEEAEANLIRGLERVDNIALTLGIYAGIFPSSLGTFERGSFEHTIVPNNMRDLPIDEKAQGLTYLTSAGIPLSVAMQLAGFTQEEIDETNKAMPQPTSGSTLQPVNGAVSLVG